MNEKEKQIEEMAKDISFLTLDREVFVGATEKKKVGWTLSEEDNKVIAESLIKQNYRKIPKDSVVLDRQEHQKYSAYKIIEPQIKGCLDRERELEKQIAELEEQRDRQAYIAEELIQEKHRWTEQTRKETAKEIIEEIKSLLYPEEGGLLAWLIAIADKYGVDVKE